MPETTAAGTSVREHASALLERIAALDGRIKAYVAVDREAVLREAARLDALPPQARGPLHGLAFGVKDLIDVAGLPTRAGSSFFERLPERDAPVIRRLREAGALVLGKTNTHEFAWGITTENPHFGRTANPYDLARIVGGSSGGSGAAVAAGLADFTLGTDTLGSIRIPSALCGTSGLRPAVGAIPLDDILPLALGLDTVGPLARDVATVERVYRVLTAPAAPAPARLRVCRLRGGGWDEITPAQAAALDDVAVSARGFAAPLEIAQVEWWEPELAAATGTVQQQAVKGDFHARLFPAHAEQYGEDVRQRVRAALAVGDDAVRAARETIARARAAWDARLAGFDLALAPVVAGEAPVAPAPESFRPQTIPLNAPASAFGLPALAVPIGRGPAGLPLGMQIIAVHGDAAAALAFGAAFQAATSWHERRPALA